MKSIQKLLITSISISLLINLFLQIPLLEPSGLEASNQDKNPKITICHRTGSKSNPYIVIQVNKNAVDGEGKNDHSKHVVDENHEYGDIIPITDVDNSGTIDVEDCYISAGITNPPEDKEEQEDNISDPDFSTFVNCVVINNNDTFTAYYGYLNRLDTDQELEESRFHPSSVTSTPPKILKSGRHDKAFSVTASIGQNIVWITRAEDTKKTATASANYFNKCTPIVDNEPEPEPNFSTFTSCIDKQDTSFTAYFGYSNRLEIDQVLDTSKVIPSSVASEVPKTLKSGTHDKVFSVTSDIDTEITWITEVGDYKQEVIASTEDKLCNSEENPDPSPIKEESDETEDSQDQDEDNNQTISEIPLEEQPLSEISISTSTPSEEESVDFQNSFEVKSLCALDKVVLSSKRIRSKNSRILLSQYSIDNGKSWYPVDSEIGIGTSELEIYTKTPKLDDKTYSIKLRVQTDSGNIYESETVKYTKDCHQEAIILGSYYSNGFGSGVLNRNSDFLYNPSLESVFYVETSGGISELYLELSEDPDFNTDSEYVELTFDSKEGIWSTPLSQDRLDRKVTYTRITSGSYQNITKEIPDIVNTEYINNESAEKNKTNETEYKYEIYTKSGLKWILVDYEAIYNTDSPNIDNALFNLLPGEYYIKSIYPTGISIYTEKFLIETPSIVKVDTDSVENSKSLFFSLFNHLDVEIYSKNSLPDTDKELNSKIIKDKSIRYKEIYENYINEDSDIIFFYWNDWNPLFSEQLIWLEEIDSHLENDKVVLITDHSNSKQLKQQLKIRESNLDFIEIGYPEFFQEEITHQPEYVLYNKDSGNIYKIRGQLSKEEFFETVDNFKFIN
jgi:hypothetical protein